MSRVVGSLVFLLLLAGSTWAQGDLPGTPWTQLSPDEQQVLQRFNEDWGQLPSEQREALRQARRWFKSLPPDRRQEMRERWQNMSPAERGAFLRQLRREFGESIPRPKTTTRPARASPPSSICSPRAVTAHVRLTPKTIRLSRAALRTG